MKRALMVAGAVVAVFVLTVVLSAVIFPDARKVAKDAAADVTDSNGCALTGIVVLEAQAVPSASKVPCVLDTLVGWTEGTQQVENGSSRHTYQTTSTEGAQWVIELHPTCNPPAEASTAPFGDKDVTRRRTDRIEGTIAIHEEWYVFAGGCAYYEVTIPERFDEQRLFRELELSFRLIDRTAINASVERRSDGAFGLDPA